jgi:hypothetical protein
MVGILHATLRLVEYCSGRYAISAIHEKTSVTLGAPPHFGALATENAEFA